MNRQNLEVMVREFLRLVVFSLPAIAIQVISGNEVASTTIGGIILGLLKSYDRSVHEDETERTGLLPF